MLEASFEESMKQFLLLHLVCPACLPGEISLEVLPKHVVYDDIVTGELCCKKCKRQFPIKNGIAILLSEPHSPPAGSHLRYEEAGMTDRYLWSHYRYILGVPEFGTRIINGLTVFQTIFLLRYVCVKPSSAAKGVMKPSYPDSGIESPQRYAVHEFIVLPSRSAIVLATLRIRVYVRAEKPRRSVTFFIFFTIQSVRP